jgi:putative restriction endonuclease
MFIIAPTDENWFAFLKNSQFNSFINFWTPTTWNVKNLKSGDKWYFLLKSPIRKIGGYGEFVEYKNMTPQAAWKEYGLRNGCNSKLDLTVKIQKYIDRNSKKHSKKNINIDNYEIGCIVLKNCVFWDSDSYIDPTNFNISIAKQVVTRKYFKQYDPFTIKDIDDFFLLDEPREVYKLEVNQRKGQGIFKGLILKAYNNKCCISDETCPELLEAAHIQHYLNQQSNHIQNGILLRVDLHRLFDNNLLYIDNGYIVRISPLVNTPHYKKYNGRKISLPNNMDDHPSLTALELRFKDFRS